ncbi:MAG: DUF4258 domain-containing protein [Nitrospirota bacterium]
MCDQLRFTDHARKEMDEEPLGRSQVEEVLQSIEAGEIIEQYLDDTPYASCLILGYTRSGRPLHLVCAPVSTEERLIVITTYQPDPNRWDQDLRRRKR